MNSKIDEWYKFCDELKEVGRIISETSDNTIDENEGFRYVLRLLRLSTEMYFEHCNPEHSSFYCLSHETGKIGADNPDNHYLNANIDSNNSYLIEGNIGGVEYLSIGVKENRYSLDGTMVSHDEIDLEKIDIDQDGNFQVTLKRGNNQNKNSLNLEPASNMIIVRQTYKNKTTDKKAVLQIKNTSSSCKSDILSDKKFTEHLSRSLDFVKGTVNTFNEWVNIFKKDHMNALPLGNQKFFQAAGGDPNIQYHHGYFKFNSDECMVIQSKIPVCEYWNFQLENNWMESLDYRFYPIHLNSHTADLDENEFIIHVTHEPIDAKNNIITCGRENGAMLLRWIGADEQTIPSVKIVKIDKLND